MNSFHLSNTPLLLQMIVNGDEYNVVEFSARMGGGSKYHLIKILSGVDIMKVYVQMIMGGKPTVTPHKEWEYAYMNYVYCYPGTFKCLNNFKEMQEQGVIHSYFTYKMPNAIIEKSSVSSDRVAGFLIVGNSKQEVNEKLKHANSCLQIINSEGKDMMRHDLFD